MNPPSLLRSVRRIPSNLAWAGAFILSLTSGPLYAEKAKQPPGPAWEDFPRAYPVPRYEMDVDTKPDYKFGVEKAFSPYKDPDRVEAEGLANPLDNPDFASYNLIVIVNKRDDPFWGKAQTLRVYKRDKPGLHYYWLISTGQKGFETPSGYYRPQAFSSRHYSNKYDAPMQWAVFFNGGMALHSSLDRQGMQEMGNAAASHGCIHVEDYRAEELFHLTGHSGYGPVDDIGRGTGRKTGKKVQSYKTLIIVAPIPRWGAATKAKKDAKPADGAALFVPEEMRAAESTPDTATLEPSAAATTAPIAAPEAPAQNASAPTESPLENPNPTFETHDYFGSLSADDSPPPMAAE